MQAERVLVVSRAARDAGVRPGMRRASVLSLAPDIRLQERDPALEILALQGVALALMQYSPLVTVTAESVVLVEVAASLRLFGGIRALRRRVRATLNTCGFTARLSIASTGAGTAALARAGAGHALHTALRNGLGSHLGSRLGSDLQSASCVSSRTSPRDTPDRLDTSDPLRPRSLHTCLYRLPLTLLPVLLPFADWFAELGCHTLGDVRKLPRAGLKRRCGESVLDGFDQALGESAELFEWITLPASFNIRQELPDRTEDAATLLASSSGLIAQLTGWLVARQMAVTRIVLWLEHERGRQAIAPSHITIALSEAVWQDSHLVRLLRERLAQTTLTAAVLAIRLEAAAIEPAAPLSESLFLDPGGNPADHQRLLELLTARLGEDHFFHSSPYADHRPDIANRWAPGIVSDKKDGQKTARIQPQRVQTGTGVPPRMQSSKQPLKQSLKQPLTLPTPPRPVWLLAMPLPLLTRQHRPFYGSPLRIVSPGERIEAGWWDDAAQTRDYFVAQAKDKSCYWVFRERLNADEGDDERWYLHGLFG